MLPILRICDSCVYYDSSSNTCNAFPEVIPLKSDDTHFDPIEGQEGEYTYEMDPNKYDELEMFQRINPQIRFPILLTYDTIDEDEALVQKSLEVESDA